MNGKATAVVLLSGLLFACAPMQPPDAGAPPAPAPAPAPAAVSAPVSHTVSIRTASCQAMLNLSPDDRAAATMFYIGYQASRFRTRAINVGSIPGIEDLALDYCAMYPDRPVVAAFAQAYSRTRR